MDTHTPLPTIYPSSKGPMEIATMPYPYLCNAIAKREREGQHDDILYALRARKDVMDIEAAALADAEQHVAEEPDEPTAREGGIGDNNPPEATPFDEVKAEIEDLRVEAGAWLDGAAVQSQAEADKLGILLEKIRLAAKRADAERVKEKQPHDDACNEIQARYNALIGKTKSVTGTAVRIEEAVKVALAGWLRKVAADQEARRQEAARVEREAREAAEQHIASTHDTTDIDDRDAALAEVDRARQAAIDLAAANKAKPQVQGETRAIGLRAVYRAEITDLTAALKHYWLDRPEEFRGLVEQFAKDDIRSGKRSGIPGITITAEQVV